MMQLHVPMACLLAAAVCNAGQHHKTAPSSNRLQSPTKRQGKERHWALVQWCCGTEARSLASYFVSRTAPAATCALATSMSRSMRLSTSAGSSTAVWVRDAKKRSRRRGPFTSPAASCCARALPAASAKDLTQSASSTFTMPGRAGQDAGTCWCTSQEQVVIAGKGPVQEYPSTCCRVLENSYENACWESPGADTGTTTAFPA